MTRIDTDQERKEARKSVSICAICGSKQTALREEKALAGFGAAGHSGIHIQSELDNPIYAAGKSENHQ